MRNKKYSSKKNFVNRRALQFVPFMMVGAVKNRPLNANAISTREKFIFLIIFGELGCKDGEEGWVATGGLFRPSSGGEFVHSR